MGENMHSRTAEQIGLQMAHQLALMWVLSDVEDRIRIVRQK